MGNRNTSHTHCPVCSSSDIRELKRYSHAFLTRCNNCGFVFTKKIPSENELEAYYSSYPVNDSISAITLKRYNELLEEFSKQTSGKKILDIGCGDGFFLQEAAKNGWECEGTEFNPAIKDKLAKKNIRIHTGTTKELSLPENSYDIITAFEVIEHLVYPSEEAREIYRLLKPGGLLYFTLPNFNSLSRRVLKEKWNVIEYPEHLSYFTPAVMHRMLEEAGFKKIFIRTSGFSPTRWKSSVQKNPGPDNEGDDKLRIKTENKMLYRIAKKLINSSLNIFGWGDTIKGLYVKPN